MNHIEIPEARKLFLGVPGQLPDQAIALFVAPAFASADEINTFTTLVEEDGYPFWIWRDEASAPDLPIGKGGAC